jgi:hypothetical protein
MSLSRRVILVGLLVGIIGLQGCLELAGQRVVWAYDQGADILTMLVFYDGLIDSGTASHGDAKEQIRVAVNDGDILFFDWPLHIARSELAKVARDETRPELSAFAKGYLKYVKVRVLGHYPHPSGVLGVAQQVTITNASGLVARANAAINAEVLRELGDGKRHERGLKYSTVLMVAAAKKGHQWIRLDRHSIVIEIPARSHEVQAMRAELAKNFIDSTRRAEPDTLTKLVRLVGSLTSSAGSFIQKPESVQFVLGFRERPETVRVKVRCEVDRSLDATVKSVVKIELSALPKWAPPEARVGLLMRKAKVSAKARKSLTQFATDWNATHEHPAAPVLKPGENTGIDGLLLKWEEWRRQMADWPTTPCETATP